MPACSLNSSPLRWVELPEPAESKLSVPGWPWPRPDVAYRVVGAGGVHDRDIGHRRHHRYRGEVLQGVVGQARVKRGIDGVADRHQRQRVAVGADLATMAAPARAAGAGPVLDDDGVAAALADLAAEDAGQMSGGAAGRERYHQPDGFAGVGVLCARGGAGASSARGRGQVRVEVRAVPAARSPGNRYCSISCLPWWRGASAVADAPARAGPGLRWLRPPHG